MKQLYEIPDLEFTHNGIGEYRCKNAMGIFVIDKQLCRTFYWDCIASRNAEYGYAPTLESAKAECNRINRELLEKMLRRVEQ